MLRKIRISGQEVFSEEGFVGTVKNVIFVETNTLHAIALLVDINGKDFEIPLPLVKIREGRIVIPSVTRDQMRLIKPSEYESRDILPIRITVLPKAINLIRGEENQQKVTSTIMLDVNDVLLSKCPVCMGKVESIEEFLFCPSCLTPYHESCINELLKSVPNEKCWNCNNVDLVKIAQLNQA
ncbi:MAG: PRC-barrel domain-containing protein [Thermoproteota archaeon]